MTTAFWQTRSVTRIGIQLPEVERFVRYDEYVAMARAAEDVGFASIWLGDHLLYRDDGRPERGPWEAWTLLAALAAETTRVDLGPLVACLAFHPPGVLAKMAATVDEISSGRLVFGVGAGWNRVEFDAFGLPFDRRAARFETNFDVIRRLLGGERLTVHDDFVDLADAVLLPPPTHRARLMIGSTGERVLTAALPHVEWWNTWFDWFANDPDEFGKLNDRVSAICGRVGRDPRGVKRSACVLVTVDGQSKERPAPVGYAPFSLDEIGSGVERLFESGADEVIVVADPIDENSIRRLGEVLF